MSTSGLSGEGTAPSDGGAAEGALPPADASEAGEKDGGGAEAGDGGLDCSGSGVVICDAFERAGPSSPLWDDVSTSSDGTLVTTNDPARGGRVLRAGLGASAASGNANLRRSTGKTVTSRIRYAFALNALGVPSAGNVGQINGVSITKGADYWNVYVHVTTEGIFLAEQSFPSVGAGAFFQTRIPSVVQGSGWHSIVVEILVGSPTRLRVTADGNEAFTKSTAVNIPSSGVVSVGAGITYSGENRPRAEVLIDDCVLSIE